MRIFLILIADAVTVAAADFKPTAQDSIVAKGAKGELVWAGGKFTEGPTLGPKGVIFFSDIGMRTMRFDPASGKTTVFREPSGKANGLMMDRKGNLIACEGAHGGDRRVSTAVGTARRPFLASLAKSRRPSVGCEGDIFLAKERTNLVV